jgi:hypothetical protein
MVGSAQIQGMDAKQMAERHIVERYLANQLTDEEALAFETYLETHPEVIRDLEVAARMKAGLATLRQRGELKKLVESQSKSRPLRLALIAASVVVLAVAVSLFLRMQPHGNAGAVLLAASAQELAGSGNRPLLNAMQIIVSRTRGGPAVITGTPASGSIVELVLEMHASPASSTYSVELHKVNGSELELVAGLPRVAPAGDGNLHLFARAEALTPGNYLIRIAEGDRVPVEFAVRVVP